MRAKRNYARWKWLFDSVCNMWGVNAIKGGPEIGVEIEVEGRSLIRENPQYHWKVTHDGSLRAVDPRDEAVEYVFRKPLDRQTTLKALEYLEKKLKDNGATVFDSDRTSVHVHLNASDLKIIDVYRWLTLYYIFEPSLMKYCGESRMGNHFCLSATDAEAVVTNIVESLQQCQVISTNNDMRYAACNYTALGKFGTLEFRAHEGTISAERIWKWIRILLAIKDAALDGRYNNPSDIVDDFSRRGPSDFAESVFGRDILGYLRTDGVDLFEGVRMAQELAYGFEWKDVQELPKSSSSDLKTKTPVQEWVFNLEGMDAAVAARPQRPVWALRENIRNNIILDEEDR